jgi:hypothetical protein
MSNKTAEYKGRKYRVAWVGETKYGCRAKLQFFDGSKEFWVAEDQIKYVTKISNANGNKHGGRYECNECGDYVTAGTRCWETGCTH